MKLIRETIENVKYITEAAENGKKSYFIEGVFMQADKRNRNGRSYPFQTLNNEVVKVSILFVIFILNFDTFLFSWRN